MYVGHWLFLTWNRRHACGLDRLDRRTNTRLVLSRRCRAIESVVARQLIGEVRYCVRSSPRYARLSLRSSATCQIERVYFRLSRATPILFEPYTLLGSNGGWIRDQLCVSQNSRKHFGPKKLFYVHNVYCQKFHFEYLKLCNIKKQIGLQSSSILVGRLAHFIPPSLLSPPL